MSKESKAKVYDFDPNYHVQDGEDYRGPYVVRDIDMLILCNGERSQTFELIIEEVQLNENNE